MSTTPPPAPSGLDSLLQKVGLSRLQGALIGALLGLILTILGFVLPFTSANVDLEKKTRRLTLALDSWRENAGLLFAIALCIFGGLALMFFSTQLVRGEERKSQALRRAIYGFNAFFGSVLVVVILLVVNVLAFTEPIDAAFGRVFSREFDWTKSAVYTLNPKTNSFLDGLDESVKVYAFISPDYIGYNETTTLLRNFQNRNKKVKWQLVPLGGTREEMAPVQAMMRKYLIKEPLGLLVIAGDENGKHDHEFIPLDKLVREDMDVGPDGRRRRGAGGSAYTGEGALLGAISSLVEGKVVIYCTQKHGELSFDGGMAPRGRANPDSISALRERLTSNRNRFEMKPLNFDRTLTRVPDDASALIIAGPKEPFNERDLKVLREYLNRKEERHPDGKIKIASGRLLILLNPILQAEAGGTKMLKTGLEPFLAESGVKVGNDRVLTLSGTDPLTVEALANPRSPTPIGRAFTNEFRQTRFLFDNVRTISPIGPEGKSAFQVDPLLLVISPGQWAETELGRDPKARAEALKNDEALSDKVLSDKPLPIAVTVSESGAAGMPRDHAHMPALKDKPRMVVFGSANWITDQGMSGARGNLRFDLFSSCLSWLREQGDIGIEVPAKKQQDYELKVPDANVARLYYLPLALMLLAVIALGTGVWVVRRR